VGGDRRIERKRFFKEGPLSLLRAFVEGTREAGRPSARPDEGPLLRPPGAAPPDRFLDLCAGSGACARVCPAQAIQMVPREPGADTRAPVIRPDEAACVVCDDLACMKACPSGALTLVPREAIRIGLARVDPAECLAWSGADESCDFCVERCPIGPSALWMLDTGEKKGPAVGEACVGCGVCEYHCPVYPGAIRVFETPA